MVKPILTVPHHILSQVAHPVTRFDAKLSRSIEDLTDTVLAQSDPIGVGISGNQIGLLQRICVIRPHEDSEEVQVLVNPEIVKSTFGSRKRKPTLEGCLSIPAVWGHVLRPKKVRVRYQDAAGEHHTEDFDGFASIVVQHEIDHLNGVLFTQHTLSQGYQLYKEVDGELEPYVL